MSTSLRNYLLDKAPFLTACVMLVAILATYASLQRGVFSIDELNLVTGSAMTLILVATGQTIVILRGGIDLSVGGMVSLGTVIAATQFGTDPVNIVLWSSAILLLGFLIGAANGVMINYLQLQPFLVTLATWSVLSGVAMIILPTDGGSVPDWWIGFGYSEFLGLAGPVWMMIALIGFWIWFKSTRLGTTIRATGSSEKSAFLSGVSIMRVDIAAYGLSGFFAAAGALYLTTQTGGGSPIIGKDYILPSVAAAVIGGVSLFGGRGGLMGTVVGAFILILIGSLVFALRISSHWQPVLSGLILLVAVLTSSLTEKTAKGQAQ